MFNLSAPHPYIPSKLNKLHLLLIPILLVGILLRFYHLGTWSFWVDEVLTVLDAKRISMEQFRINTIPYLAVKFSMSIAGENEWGARLIPCIVGIVSILLVFMIGRSLFNQRVGIFASTFVAFSSWHLLWSQNARHYIFTFFFGALAAWTFFLAMERNRLRFLVVSLGATILLILCHMPSGLIVPAFAGYVVGFWRGKIFREQPAGLRLRNLVIFFLPLAAPLLFLALPSFRDALFSGWGLNEWARSPFYILFTVVHGLSVPAAVAAFFTALTRPMNRAVWFLICYAGIPLILLLIVSQLLNVAGYYVFFTAPAYFLLAAIGCDRIWAAKHNPIMLRCILPGVIIITMLSQVYIYFHVENGGRAKWREAFSTIQSDMRAGDLVVASIPQVGEYYLPERETIALEGVMDDIDRFEQMWKSKGQRVWFVLDAATLNVLDAGEQFRRRVRRQSRLIRTHPVSARAKNRTINVYLADFQK